MADQLNLTLTGAPFGDSRGRAVVRGLTGADLMDLQDRAAPPAELALRLARRVMPLSEGPADAADLTAFDLNRVLLGAFAAGVTSEPRLLADCPDCGERVEIRLEIGNLLDIAPCGHAPEARLDGGTVRLRALSAGDLAEAGRIAARDPRGAAAFLRGRAAPEECKADPEALDALFDEVNIAGEFWVGMCCTSCGASFQRRLDPLAMVRREAEMSGEILRDVARLAAAFGWTSSETLGLPQKQRRRFLELLADSEPTRKAAP